VGLFKKLKKAYKKALDPVQDIIDKNKKIVGVLPIPSVGGLPQLPGSKTIKGLKGLGEGLNESIDKLTGKDALHDTARELARMESGQASLEEQLKKQQLEERRASMALQEAMLFSLRRQRPRGGSLLTGPQGLSSNPSTAYKSLLGR
jgi:hypothetical protein